MTDQNKNFISDIPHIVNFLLLLLLNIVVKTMRPLLLLIQIFILYSLRVYLQVLARNIYLFLTKEYFCYILRLFFSTGQNWEDGYAVVKDIYWPVKLLQSTRIKLDNRFYNYISYLSIHFYVVHLTIYRYFLCLTHFTQNKAIIMDICVHNL